MIWLGGRRIEYRFSRRSRRTLGITVDAGGLRVAAPLRAPWRDIEGFLRDKERWIVSKLDEWAGAPRAATIEGRSGETLSLFGRPVTLEVLAGRAAVRREGDVLFVTARAGRAVDALVRWLKGSAVEALTPRAAHYAGLLNRPAPAVTLSNARTQWGVCTERGAIRLSWRLVHVAPELADYVVAHEVAHLAELNHSPRFWRLVETLYPDWRAARQRLDLEGAALPIFSRTAR